MDSLDESTSKPEPKPKDEPNVICGGAFEFKWSAVLGRGGFSVVRRGRDLSSHGLVAVKCFSASESTLSPSHLRRRTFSPYASSPSHLRRRTFSPAPRHLLTGLRAGDEDEDDWTAQLR